MAEGCHTMTIRDSYGDGLSVGGSNPGYVLRIDGSVVQRKQVATTLAPKVV